MKQPPQPQSPQRQEQTAKLKQFSSGFKIDPSVSAPPGLDGKAAAPGEVKAAEPAEDSKAKTEFSFNIKAASFTPTAPAPAPAMMAAAGYTPMHPTQMMMGYPAGYGMQPTGYSAYPPQVYGNGMPMPPQAYPQPYQQGKVAAQGGMV